MTALPGHNFSFPLARSHGHLENHVKSLLTLSHRGGMSTTRISYECLDTRCHVLTARPFIESPSSQDPTDIPILLENSVNVQAIQ